MNGHMMDNSPSQTSSYSIEQWIALISGIALLIFSTILLVFYLIRHPDEKATYPLRSQIPNHFIERGRLENDIIEKPKAEARKQEENLIGQLLEGDEKKLYELIVMEGGQVVQKEIVARKIFSKAKVTRLLDKLEKRGIVVRERYGSTNKIKLVR